MRTFHTGGVAGIDITSGLPRVEELFEARVPKGAAVLSDIDGKLEVSEDPEGRRLKTLTVKIIARIIFCQPNQMFSSKTARKLKRALQWRYRLKLRRLPKKSL